MNVPIRVQQLLHQLANCNERARFLNRELNKEFEKLGVDISSQQFIDAFGYVEGDCWAEPIIMYLEEL